MPAARKARVAALGAKRRSGERNDCELAPARHLRFARLLWERSLVYARLCHTQTGTGRALQSGPGGKARQ